MFYSYQEVQIYLTDFYRRFHYKLSFPEAVTLMGTSVAAHETMEQPDFLTWDAKSEEALKALIYQLPVEIGQFSPSRKEKLHHPHPENKKIKQVEILAQVGIVLETIDQRSEMCCTNFFKLLYVIKGSCLVRIRGAQFQIREQQVVLFSPMIQHEQVISDPASVILMMGISEKTVEQFALPGLAKRDKLFHFLVRTSKNSQKGIAILDIQKDFALYEFIRLLWHYYSQPNNGFFQRQMQLVFSLFLNQADFLASDTAVFYEDSIVYSDDTMMLDIYSSFYKRTLRRRYPGASFPGIFL